MAHDAFAAVARAISRARHGIDLRLDGVDFFGTDLRAPEMFDRADARADERSAIGRKQRLTSGSVVRVQLALIDGGRDIVADRGMHSAADWHEDAALGWNHPVSVYQIFEAGIAAASGVRTLKRLR